MPENKTAFITGGTKGIGYSIAEALLKDGCNVAITGRSSETVNAALGELREFGRDRVQGHVSDVRNYESQVQSIAATVDHFGGIDYLIANAGLGHFESVFDMTNEQWEETIDVNLTGAFYTLKAGLDALKASKGYYITIASLAGTNFFANGSAYNASKFGLVGFTQAAMLDLRKYGIKTTTIMPGSVATYFNDNQPSEADSWKIQPEDIGQMVVDLVHIHPRTLPSKIEVRPTVPPSAK